MKIVSGKLETVHWPIAGDGAARGRTTRASVLVELVGETGAAGLGEAAPLPGVSSETIEQAEAALGAFVARLPLDLADTEGLTGWFVAIAQVTVKSARFALETAWKDLEARAHGMPMTFAFGGNPRAHRLASAVVVETPARARQAVLAGARTLKIKVGPQGDIDRVLAIHRAAPDAALRLDANRSWPRAAVAAYLHALADLPIEFIEEPCVDTIALLDEPSPIPLALDESLVGLSGDPLKRALGAPSLGALVIKPTLVGGMYAAALLAKRARAAGKRAVITHALEGPIGTAACAILALGVNDATTAAGLAPHPGLDGWPVRLPYLRATEITSPMDPGLGVLLTTRLDEPVRVSELATHMARHATDVEAANAIAVITPIRSVRFDELDDGEIANDHPSIAHTLLATPTIDTIRAIHAAFANGRPLALLHPKLPAAELDRQRAVIAATPVPDETAVVLFTSGSTGVPRGVVVGRGAIDAALAMSEANLGWQRGDRWLLALPMAHAGGLSVVLRCRAARVAVALLEGDWDRDRGSELLVDCTLASLVPTQLASLLEDPAWRPPPSLRAVLLGGAAATPALLEAAANRGVPILASYGLTETFGQIATAPRGQAGDPRAPVIPLPGVSIIGGTRDVPALLRVTSPSLATRYLDGTPIAPVLTTADLGFVEDNAIHIVGRADDVIITGGENVHPNEIEAVLAATAGVRSALVFGVPDDRWGQRVAAAVAVDPTFDTSHAQATWRTRLAAHQLPRELAVVDALPQLANGKLDRRAAAQLARHALDWR